MKDITIIITTFLRPGCLKRCVESIRKYYPDIRIIVSDNGKTPPNLIYELTEIHKCKYLKLRFDSGASHAKNAALDITESKYAVIIDDDFEFTRNTNLEKFKIVLESDDNLGIVGGKPISPSGKVGTRGSKLLINKKKEMFWRFPIEIPDWKEIKGIEYYYADYTRQFLLIRNVPDIRWDNDLKIGGLHVAFFINIKLHANWRVAYVPEVEVIHHRSRPASLGYMFYRRRKDFKKKLYEKTGLRYGIFHNHTIFDFKYAKKIKPPDFERFNVFKLEAQ
ncbi:MAG: glycosyltransferase [Candidatus Cloacimonadota bacterium]|nr:MAG: glycosyltransferase [Candidatus Cloacimonadota bacterium]